jgi:hypothetical protein
MPSLWTILLTVLLAYLVRVGYKLYRTFSYPAVFNHYPYITMADFWTYMLRSVSYDTMWKDLFRPRYATSDYVVACILVVS